MAYAEVSPKVCRINEILTFSTPIVPQSYQIDVSEHMGRVKDFIARMKQGMCLLGDDIKMQDLLLPQWCRIHHQEHSKISYIRCQNEVMKLMSPVPCEDVDYVINMEQIEVPNHERVIPQKMEVVVETSQLE